MPDRTKEELRDEIRRLTAEYHRLAFHKGEFRPGEDPVPVSGMVFDADEMEHLVDASLDFWLTTGRFADQFEREFPRFVGVRECSLVNSGSSANLLALTALTSPQLGDRALRPGDEVVGHQAGQGQDVGERGAVTEALEMGRDRHPGAAHRVAPLAADRGHLEIAGVFRDLAGDETDRVGVQRPGEAAVAGHDHDEAVVLATEVPVRQERVVGPAEHRREVRDDLVERLAIGAGGERGLLRTPQLGGCDELHRPGDLLDVLGRSDPAPDLALARHCSVPPTSAGGSSLPRSAQARKLRRKASIASPSAVAMSSVRVLPAASSVRISGRSVSRNR